MGNGCYSFTLVEDIAKYHRYLCKGESEGAGPHVVAAYGVQYTDTWVLEQHEAYWEQNAAIQLRRQHQPVLEAALSMCKEQGIQWHNDHAIARCLLQLLSSRGKPINLYQVRSQTNLLMVLLCPDDSALDRLARAVTAKE